MDVSFVDVMTLSLFSVARVTFETTCSAEAGPGMCLSPESQSAQHGDCGVCDGLTVMSFTSNYRSADAVTLFTYRKTYAAP
jgi:hypothetical protein